LFGREGSAENGGMRSKEEIRRIVEGFAKSGMTRREYCAKHRVAMTTLDYWRRAHRKPKPRLVGVEVEPAQPAGGFALVLANGRRIESSWSFVEADLEKLIRAAEA
jgi:transposase-like protein